MYAGIISQVSMWGTQVFGIFGIGSCSALKESRIDTKSVHPEPAASGQTVETHARFAGGPAP
jgi:hypothetical protein